MTGKDTEALEMAFQMLPNKTTYSEFSMSQRTKENIQKATKL